MSVWRQLTPRDRIVLALIADNRVLTTDHLHALAFTSRRRAQARLARLCELGLLWRFRFS